MNTYILKNQKIQLTALGILAVGLAVGIYLVQNTQIFKPKANINQYDAFTVTSNEPGKTVTRTGPNTYSADTLNVNIKLQDLNALTEP